jgi:hypothetical protein
MEPLAMTVHFQLTPKSDLAEGYRFYERQSPGLASYFRSCLISDIESLGTVVAR